MELKHLAPYLKWIITLQLKLFSKYGMFSSNGKYKKGDIVKYNWKAKVYIYSAIKEKFKPRQISKICYSDKSGLDFTDGESCDAFWVRRLRFWEKGEAININKI